MITRVLVPMDDSGMSERVLRYALEAHPDAEITTEVQIGHPVRAIFDRAEQFDTVVLGSHGGTVTERLFVENVAEKLFRRSPVPVTVVR